MDNQTKLKYMEDSYILEDESMVVNVLQDEKGNDVLILNQTIFYPQGGGQPYDQGYIKNDQNVFKVNEVRYFEGIVHHIGKIESGQFNKDDKVELSVDLSIRSLNRRNHTAGHLIDVAIKTIGSFTPLKGFHFPQGSYVEYQGVFDEAKKEEIKMKLQEEINKLIQQSLLVTVRFVPKEQLAEFCDFVPEWLPKDKPTRLVTIGSFKGHPCGGTHVKNTSEIGTMTIEKVGNKKGNTRVSYKIA